MNLLPGDRISSGSRTAYVINGSGRSVSRHRAYPARKVFWNARTQAGRIELVEADEEEQLAVVVRVPEDGGKRAIEDLRFEAGSVLSLPGAPGLPEPLDLMAEEGREPWLVIAAASGESLEARRLEGVQRARFLEELRGLLGIFHQAGLMAGPLEPLDFVIDGSGRWTFLGTDRVSRAESSGAIAEDARHVETFARRF